ncbi:RNA polymerase sigma factor [Paenarthrobacter sp. NPDC089675]|uniref:RNA polymerase sigma factor n=1 Tax=Paenarthrobacter sp. NPDC089675 TaxID=3364376 RepID=UPI00382E395C
MKPVAGTPPKRPFEAIVAEHGATVLRVCRAVVGLHDAEDAWSETFLAALRAYPDLPSDANVQAWLVTISHRKCIDLLRANSRRAIPVEQIPEQASRIGIPGDRHTELLDAVGQLPAKQRQAVAYHHLAGLPYKDVAALVGGTAESARRAASDGIRTLRSALHSESTSNGRPLVSAAPKEATR